MDDRSSRVHSVVTTTTGKDGAIAQEPIVYENGGLTIHRLQPAIGAEITGVDLTRPVPDETKAAIRQALLDHAAIVFRDQDLTREQYLEFGRIFAKSAAKPFVEYAEQPDPVPGFPQMLALITQFTDGKICATPDTWHTDDVMSEVPSVVTMNRAYYVPELGGDTVFSSAMAAYEGLDEATKAAIEDATIVYAKHLVSARKDSKNYRASLFAAPPVEHPAVRVHPDTGQRVLFDCSSTRPPPGRWRG